MTQHPGHRLRVLVWSIDYDGSPRLSAVHSFTQLSAAIGFQMDALARPSIARADLVLLLNSSEKQSRITPSLVPIPEGVQ